MVHKIHVNYNCGCGFSTNDLKKAIGHIKSTRETKQGETVKGGHTINIKGQIIDE